MTLVQIFEDALFTSLYVACALWLGAVLFEVLLRWRRP